VREVVRFWLLQYHFRKIVKMHNNGWSGNLSWQSTLLEIEIKNVDFNKRKVKH